MNKPLVLILCTGNSCRSQMAEGFLRRYAGDILEVASAGSKPAGYVHPMAIQAMAEAGIDLSTHHSKHLKEFETRHVSILITVCGHAGEACPIFPGHPERIHLGFEDPPHSIRPGETEIDAFRRIRDEIQTTFQSYALGFRHAHTLHNKE